MLAPALSIARTVAAISSSRRCVRVRRRLVSRARCEGCVEAMVHSCYHGADGRSPIPEHHREAAESVACLIPTSCCRSPSRCRSSARRRCSPAAARCACAAAGWSPRRRRRAARCSRGSRSHSMAGRRRCFASPGCRRSTSRSRCAATASALFFALLVSGVGVLVALYSLAYLGAADADRARRYYAALAVFMGAMLGIALADDLILLFVFWEITSIASFLLIGHRFEDDDAKAGALTALQVTALGGLVMSVGFLLDRAGRRHVLAQLLIAADPRPQRAAARLAARHAGRWCSCCCGAFTKSAQVPFHFWLPQRDGRADAGLGLPARRDDGEGGRVPRSAACCRSSAQSPLWLPLLVAVGAHDDAARRLSGDARDRPEGDPGAHHGLDARPDVPALRARRGRPGRAADAQPRALQGGAVPRRRHRRAPRAHARPARSSAACARDLPLAFVACLLAALSMAGIPPLLGFLAKEAFYGVLLTRWRWSPPAARAGAVVLIASVVVAARCSRRPRID